MTPVRLSAAVCTRERPRLLERALESLLRQSVPPAEILVVENAPAGGDTRSLVASRFPSVRYVAEPVPGLDFARNRALAEARHEVLAFLERRVPFRALRTLINRVDQPMKAARLIDSRNARMLVPLHHHVQRNKDENSIGWCHRIGGQCGANSSSGG